jgi:plastocyanin
LIVGLLAAIMGTEDDDQVRRPLLTRASKAHRGAPAALLSKQKQGGSCMAITRKEFLKLGTLGLVGGVGLALSSVAGAQSQRTRTVVIQDFSFKPAHITIRPGTKVIWINNDSTQHTVTANNGAFDSGFLRKGQRYARTFKRAGKKYAYHCEPHPHMMGSVTVKPR